MEKCNTQAKDMATTANNWRTPGATNPGRYREVCKDDGDDMLVVSLRNYIGRSTVVCPRKGET